MMRRDAIPRQFHTKIKYHSFMHSFTHPFCKRVLPICVPKLERRMHLGAVSLNIRVRARRTKQRGLDSVGCKEQCCLPE